jgi:hypothetical protein
MLQLKTSHLLRVYEGEFHPLGMVALEACEGCAGWLRDGLNDNGGPTGVERVPEFNV